MKWSQPQKGNGIISRYDHITCESPLGLFIIEWKSVKDNDDFSLSLLTNGSDTYLSSNQTLEMAKKYAYEHLVSISKSLNEFLK